MNTIWFGSSLLNHGKSEPIAPSTRLRPNRMLNFLRVPQNTTTSLPLKSDLILYVPLKSKSCKCIIKKSNLSRKLSNLVSSKSCFLKI